MSKVDAIRAMREARHSERGRPSKETPKPPRTKLQREIDELIAPKQPRPDPEPAKPAPNVATKVKKQTAEVIGKVREGKRQLNVWLDDDLMKRLKIQVAASDRTLEAVVAEAVELWMTGQP